MVDERVREIKGGQGKGTEAGMEVRRLAVALSVLSDTKPVRPSGNAVNRFYTSVLGFGFGFG